MFSRSFSQTITGKMKVMSLKSINQDVVKFEYAVRGALAIRAEELKLTRPIISCNIGNPQQLGQKPITFLRQVLALLEVPEMKSDFPKDAVSRAQELLESMGSMGAYSHSQGIPLVRQRVADFISRRDGVPSNPDDIFLTAGASAGVQSVLQTLIANPKVGVMIPIPQYPLYSASIALYRGNAVHYYLNESNEWAMNITELTRSLKESRDNGIDVRALCVINPGNPTGQVLSKSNMKDVVSFCASENLVLLADEVYQTNTYLDRLPFVSFKSIVHQMKSPVELISFHSISKGVVGECGRRGGYFECTNIDSKVKDMFYKMASVSLCPPVSGQVAVEVMVNPPKSGQESYSLYRAETNGIYESLKRRAMKLGEAFNSLDGVSCQPAQGSMYLFPSLTLPPKAIEAAKKSNQEPDAMYAMALLNATGVCVVPGSGFGQAPGSIHIRSTFLPPEDQMHGFIESIRVFHNDFIKKYQ